MGDRLPARKELPARKRQSQSLTDGYDGLKQNTPCSMGYTKCNSVGATAQGTPPFDGSASLMTSKFC